MARASVDSLAEVLKEAASLLDEKAKGRLNADLKSRGMSVERVKSLLGLVARKEG